MNEAAILDYETNHKKSEDFDLENSVLLVGVWLEFGLRPKSDTIQRSIAQFSYSYSHTHKFKYV